MFGITKRRLCRYGPNWAEAITVTISVLLFGAGVIANGIRDHRQRESAMMERAAAGVVTASSKVLSALKALERAESASETALDRLDDAIDGLASAHASLILAFGHAWDRPASPPTAADWSRTLNRVSLTLAGHLRGDKAVADVLDRPANDKELAQELIDRASNRVY
jgi:hypothetical protein